MVVARIDETCHLSRNAHVTHAGVTIGLLNKKRFAARWANVAIQLSDFRAAILRVALAGSARITPRLVQVLAACVAHGAQSSSWRDTKNLLSGMIALQLPAMGVQHLVAVPLIERLHWRCFHQQRPNRSPQCEDEKDRPF
jgi:hypothetical protein